MLVDLRAAVLRFAATVRDSVKVLGAQHLNPRTQELTEGIAEFCTKCWGSFGQISQFAEMFPCPDAGLSTSTRSAHRMETS